MGLSQSLYTGWSGMATHQAGLDNLSNNLANVNTVGYKKSDFVFGNLLGKSITGAMAAADDRGSINGKSVGLGVTTAAIQNNMLQGPMETTNNPLDVAITGNGFFLVGTGRGTALTRNGSFYLDDALTSGQRYLCVGNGLRVQGWNAANGAIAPSTTIGDILLPSIGDTLTGTATSKVNLSGILPSNTGTSDFSGAATTDLDVKGNLSAGTSTLTTTIYAPVTQTGGSSTFQNEVQEITVEIGFSGPTLSEDGTVSAYSWTMKTLDWPTPGSPQTQIYPAAGGTAPAIRFYAQSDPDNHQAAGQAVDQALNPGSASVNTQYVDADGNTVSLSFTIPSSFEFDVSRLTALADAPGGNELATWSVNGNPKGSMARTVTVYGEYTDFVRSVDASGNAVMEAIKKVEARENTLHFTRTSTEGDASVWEWQSSSDGASGALTFNSQGDLTNSSQSGGAIAYGFNDVRTMNSTGSLQIADQDGFRDGTLESISIDQYGVIHGHYTNGIAEPLAQLAIGTVANATGLSGSAGTLFHVTPASGDLQIGAAGDTGVNGLAPVGAGLLSPQTLEGSNVDLTVEFTSLISIERGYQLNARVISTSNEMLQELLGMKR